MRAEAPFPKELESRFELSPSAEHLTQGFPAGHGERPAAAGSSPRCAPSPLISVLGTSRRWRAAFRALGQPKSEQDRSNSPTTIETQLEICPKVEALFRFVSIVFVSQARLIASRRRARPANGSCASEQPHFLESALGWLAHSISRAMPPKCLEHGCQNVYKASCFPAKAKEAGQVGEDATNFRDRSLETVESTGR